jgi:hypothetical protein
MDHSGEIVCDFITEQPLHCSWMEELCIPAGKGVSSLLVL